MIPNSGEDLLFLTLEVTKQLENVERVIAEPDAQLVSKIQKRDDYVDHLRGRIENNSFAQLQDNIVDKNTLDAIRSLTVIAGNLEHMADHGVSIVRQCGHLKNPQAIPRERVEPFFSELREGLKLVYEAFRDRDSSMALRICQCELKVDQLYRVEMKRILQEMESGVNIPDLVTSIFVFHYLERMGDSLLNIGEAILLSRIGEKLKLKQYRSLQGMLMTSGAFDVHRGELDVEGIWGTKSGTSIGRLVPEGTHGEDSEDKPMIYKSGNRTKILEEKTGIERWREIRPGIPPQILGYQEAGEEATLLIGYVSGSTFQDIVLDPESPDLKVATRAIQSTLKDVWLSTRKEGTVRPAFLKQVLARLDDIYRVHPSLAGEPKQIGDLQIPSFQELLAMNLHLDDELVAPFSVFIHGDFNLDNIIFNSETGEVHFIDLHRSRSADYVQDLSVFLVSNFRIPIFEPRIRKRLHKVMRRFFRFGQKFASKTGDDTFEARLALGLVRSFITSTRFEFGGNFAKAMEERASYLLQRLQKWHDKGRPWETFELPENILHYLVPQMT